MDPIRPTAPLLPADVMAEVEAAAAVEQRSPGEVVREAVVRYLQDRGPLVGTAKPGVSRRTPEEAVARIRDRRRTHALPESLSIRDLMIFGRK